MRGGHRYRAGRPGWHNSVGTFYKIDIRRWVREGSLKSKDLFGYKSLDAYGRAKFLVAAHASDDAISVITMRYDENGKPVTTFRSCIQLIETKPHLGGHRTWFVCPHCRRRAAVLYFSSGKWACQKSLRLVYPSQSEKLITRVLRRIEKLEDQLDPNWARPKGMRRKTHEKIIEKIEIAEERRQRLFIEGAKRLLGWT